MVTSLQVAPQARVPLVKLQPQKDGPTVDVCIGSKESVRKSRLLGVYMSLDPRARYVVELPKPSGVFEFGHEENDLHPLGVMELGSSILLISFDQMEG